jgi:hypothetical protein
MTQKTAKWMRGLPLKFSKFSKNEKKRIKKINQMHNQTKYYINEKNKTF